MTTLFDPYISLFHESDSDSSETETDFLPDDNETECFAKKLNTR